MNIKNLTRYGILFHQFHSSKSFYKSPGSLEKDTFYKFIKNNIKRIKSPEEFLNSKNSDKTISLTFDDGLKCQYKIALDVLENFKIKAFFFIFSEFLENKHFTVENIRYFTYKYFKNRDYFYKSFFKTYEDCFSDKLTFEDKKSKILFRKYKKQSKYYSSNDIIFKIARDNQLDQEKYIIVMLEMMKRKKINLKSLTKKLYMSKKDIKNLSNLNHVIGLHSHSHNHKNYEYSLKEEFDDYKKNKNILEKIIKKKIYCSSYPFGNFTNNSEKVLKKLNIKYAFCKNSLINNKFKNKNYCLPRENISNLLKV
jgi:peptidoglycan/xylan/chitin deacetylase (PgdA/CDA1 family)